MPWRLWPVFRMNSNQSQKRVPYLEHLVLNEEYCTVLVCNVDRWWCSRRLWYILFALSFE